MANWHLCSITSSSLPETMHAWQTRQRWSPEKLYCKKKTKQEFGNFKRSINNRWFCAVLMENTHLSLQKKQSLTEERHAPLKIKAFTQKNWVHLHFTILVIISTIYKSMPNSIPRFVSYYNFKWFANCISNWLAIISGLVCIQFDRVSWKNQKGIHWVTIILSNSYHWIHCSIRLASEVIAEELNATLLLADQRPEETRQQESPTCRQGLISEQEPKEENTKDFHEMSLANYAEMQQNNKKEV